MKPRKITPAEYDAARGPRVQVVIFGQRRGGYMVNGWFYYIRGRDYLKIEERYVEEMET